jgi:hypothetical protein
MKAMTTDARRFAWCQSRAMWLMGPPAGQWIEDLEGAVAAGQVGLARHAARQLAEDCAVMIALAVGQHRPVPVPSLRGAWALALIEGHALEPECRALISGLDDDSDLDELLDRCHRLQEAVRDIVGNVPDPLTPEGYFPALGLTRDWMTLLGALDEEGPLPREWTRR